MSKQKRSKTERQQNKKHAAHNRDSIESDPGAPPPFPGINMEEKQSNDNQKDVDTVEEFSYFPSELTLRQFEICPLCLPRNIKFPNAKYSITPKLPSGIKFDRTSGAISGATSMHSKVGSQKYKISCVNTDVIGIKYVAEINIKIIAAECCIETWIQTPKSNGKLHCVTHFVNEKFEDYKIKADGYKVDTIKRYKYIKCSPYNEDLIFGIKFDEESGTFNGRPKKCGKCSFKIKIITNSNQIIMTSPFVIDVINKKTDRDENVKKLSIMEINEYAKQSESIELNVDNIYELLSNKDGLTQDNLHRALCLLKKNVNSAVVRKLFNKHKHKSDYVNLKQLESILQDGKLKNIEWDVVKECFVDLFGNCKDDEIDKTEFESMMTTRGDILNENCLKTIYEIVDGNNTGKLDFSVFKKLLSR